MKAYLIKASAGSEFSKYKAKMGGPPQNIFSTAAATPNHIEIEMCDETIGMKTRFDSSADIVAIFMSTPDALRAYHIADTFRNLGKTVVLGGLHTNFNQEEAKSHADTLLIGEVEEIWEELLNDFSKGQLKPLYKREKPFDLSKLKPYPTHIIPPEKYNYAWSVVITRGCPFKCEFCLVHKFFQKFELRPIENIVSELKMLKKQGIRWVELHSDNLTQNKEYAIELFKAIAPLKMNFFGETSITIARDKELLLEAKKAGLKMVLLGIETISKKALKDQNKSFVKPEKIKEQVALINSFGIKVVGDFLFGFDAHDTSIFEETYEFIKDMEMHEVYPHLMIPFPGSNTFEKLDKDNRILTKDWSKYDGTHAVYQPKQMTPEELEKGLEWFWMKNASIWEKISWTILGN